MPRPKNKPELLHLSQANFERLMEFIESFPMEEQLKGVPEGTMNRNIRDVLAHLYHWHLMLLDWYRVGMQGEKHQLINNHLLEPITSASKKGEI